MDFRSQVKGSAEVKMKTKYQIITELEDRNIKIDKEIDELIQEKLNNKDKIEQLSSFNKE